MSTVTLFGPQRLQPSLAGAVRDRGITGTIATITAGWQEREGEDQELDQHLDGRTVNLRLYRRSEQIFREDPELNRWLHERQEILRQLQDLYRARLHHAMEAARKLLRWRGAPPTWLAEHQESALRTIRSLDEEHMRHVAAVHDEFEAAIRPAERDGVVRERGEVEKVLADSGAEAIAIAGGHVAVLLNRLRLFGLPGLQGGRHLLAWAAGAMVAGERIVLFHDSPPQGPGNAEVLEAGLGFYEGLLPLPDARHRLRLADRDRVALFARRFHPARCVALDQGARVDRTADGWTAATPGIRYLDVSGDVREMGTR